ncbi:hypothetical protein CEP54_016206 [Fusarium duplospermum]|uniref:Uncharacterized protein n=1 Tax=Fusarium duplospermum TaxID=1325734 RepID=A0A428NGW1_9HYPO|nr:hypothetical protein CEP54_016206 [Fusarium duplospermum]
MSSSRTERSSSNSARGGQRQPRIVGHQTNIARQLRKSVVDLATVFNHSDSQKFWEELWSLVKICHPRHSWEDILAALNRSREKRKSGKKTWQPMDAKLAKDELQGLVMAVMDSSPSLEADLEEDLEGEPGVHVIFCPIGTPEDLSDEQGAKSNLVVPTDPHKGEMLTSMASKDWEKLEEDVGPGMCSNAGKKRTEEAKDNPLLETPTGPDAVSVWVHTVLVALLWARTTGRISLECHDWGWLAKKLQDGSLVSHIQLLDKPVVVFTHMRRPHWRAENWKEECNTDRLYALVKRASGKHKVRCYPAQDEIIADCGREFDIRALDAIAKEAPANFSWRPRVCYGEPGPCKMDGYRGDMFVLAPSDTGPGQTYHGSSDSPALLKLLGCQSQSNDTTSHSTPRSVPRGKNRRGTVATADRVSTVGRHIHLEKLESLESFGEIYVIMIDGKVTHKIITVNEGCKEPKDPYRSGLDPVRTFKDWTGFGHGEVTDDQAKAKGTELDEFCRYTYNGLIKYDPLNFETLRHGLKMDVGMSEPGPHGRFFVLGLGRWPGADLYAPYPGTTAPYDEIPRALGKLFARKFGFKIPPPREEGGEGEEGEQSEESEDSEESDDSDDSNDEEEEEDIGEEEKEEGEEGEEGEEELYRAD